MSRLSAALLSARHGTPASASPPASRKRRLNWLTLADWPICKRSASHPFDTAVLARITALFGADFRAPSLFGSTFSAFAADCRHSSHFASSVPCAAPLGTPPIPAPSPAHFANPRKLALISAHAFKHDRQDAETLARLGRSDPALLSPILHRGLEAQADLRVLLTREQLVTARSALACHLRGSVKSFGGRLPSGHPHALPVRAKPYLPAVVAVALQPVLEAIDALNLQIRALDAQIERLIAEKYPQAQRLQQIPGVGPLTALAFVLIVEHPERFARNRDIGAFLGLVPRRDQSGQCNKQLRITKAGNPFMRKLLVNAAQHILGPFAPASHSALLAHIHQLCRDCAHHATLSPSLQSDYEVTGRTLTVRQPVHVVVGKRLRPARARAAAQIAQTVVIERKVLHQGAHAAAGECPRFDSRQHTVLTSMHA